MSRAADAVPAPDLAAGPAADPLLEEQTLWRVSLRLIPFLFLLYLVNILDRVNVGFARLQMLDDVGMDEAAYGLGGSIFFLGYFVFEVPSNLMLRHVGARRWLARILVSWGIISSCMMFVRDAWSFCLLRFLLGLAEAGFFPGMILYLSYWFPTAARARAVSRCMTASAVTGIVGGPISGALLQYTNGVGGLAGWQWLFLLEGIPAVVLGILVLFYLTDRPEQAHWLRPAERDWLADRMGREEKHRERHHGLTLRRALANPRVLLLGLIYFTVSMGANSFGLYMPALIDEHFSSPGKLPLAGAVGGFGPYLAGLAGVQFGGLSKFQVGLLASVPNLVAVVSMVLVGMHSDRTGERRWHVAVPALVAAAGWAMVALLPDRWLVMLGLCLAQAGMMSMLAPFWALPTSFLSGAAAAGGIALINAVGNLGGFVAPNVIGQLKTLTGSFSGGLLCLAAVLVVGGFLALRARHDAALERQGGASGSG